MVVEVKTKIIQLLCNLFTKIFCKIIFCLEHCFLSRISTTEETFQSHIIDSTIFQTNSLDVLSEFALLVSYTTCSAYSSALSRESEKMSQQNKRKILFHLNKFFMIQIFFEQSHYFDE